jgi:hypothetical protein
MIYAMADNFENMLNKISEKKNKEKIENLCSTIGITIENTNNKTNIMEKIYNNMKVK